MSQVITVPIIGSAPPPPPPPSGPFRDNFNRSDRLLVGDNGWVNTTGVGDGVSPFRIVNGTVQVLTDTGVGSFPILHMRYDANPGVADVTMTFKLGSAAGAGPLAGFSALVVASNLGYSEAVGLYFDGSSGGFNFFRNHLGAGSLEVPDNITSFNGGLTPWLTAGAYATLRGVYTEATRLLEVYQNGVKKASCSMHISNFSMYSDGELPALTTMPYGGFWASSGSLQDILDDFNCGPEPVGTWTYLAAGYTATDNKIMNAAGTRQAVVKSTPGYGALSGLVVLDMTPPAGSSLYFGASLRNIPNDTGTSHWVDGSDANFTLDWPSTVGGTGYNQGFGRVRIIDSGTTVGEYEPAH